MSTLKILCKKNADSEILNRGQVVGSLPFLGLFIGVCTALPINLANRPRHARLMAAAGGRPVPGARLAPVAIGGLLFAIGLFWFGWTASRKILWVSPVIAAIFIGAGFSVVFQNCLNFLVDTYGGLYSASAVSANTFLRSLLGAGFPLIAMPMFHNLGVGPAMSILGGIAVRKDPPFL